jgi:uncharacterized protein YegL
MSDPFLSQPIDAPANPSLRFPIALCLDVSSSLQGEPIAELNGGLAELYEAIRNDSLAAASAQIGVFAFAGAARQIGPFDNLREESRAPRLEVLLGGRLAAGGLPDGTDLAKGI